MANRLATLAVSTVDDDKPQQAILWTCRGNQPLFSFLVNLHMST
jgi:hypothetical protein